MLDVFNLIEGWETKSVTELVEVLNTPSVEQVDDQLYTWAGIAILVGPTGAEALRISLESSGMGWVVHQLGGTGIQLSNPLVQQALTGFAAKGVTGAQDLKDQGKRLVSPWVKSGRSGMALPADVEAGIAEVQLTERKQQLKQDGANRWSAFVDAVEAWDGSGETPVL
jgi:hypothetical protein